METQPVQGFHTVRRNNGNIYMETQSVIFPEFRTVLINGNIDAIITLNSNVQQSNTLKISIQEGGVPPKITCFIDYNNNNNNVLNIVRSVDSSNVTTSGGGTSPKTPIPLVHIEVNNLQNIILTGPAGENTYTINGNNDDQIEFSIKINGTGYRKIINEIEHKQQADVISLKSYGPGPFALIGEAKTLDVELYNLARVLLRGHATCLHVSVFGASLINAKQLIVDTKVGVTYHNDIGKAYFNTAAKVNKVNTAAKVNEVNTAAKVNEVNTAAKVNEARDINSKVDVTYHDILAYFNSAAKINQAPDINNNVQYDNNNAQDDIKLGPKMGGR